MKIININCSLSFFKIPIFFILTIVPLNLLRAQNGPQDFDYFDNILNRNMNVIDMSVPDVKSVQRYNLSPAKEYTGKLNVSIPIFNIKAGKISYPINISYDTSGIKIADEAPRVGLGWSLSNSLIVRKVIDGHDFDETGKTKSETNPAVNDCNNQCFDQNSSVNKRLGYFKYKDQNAKLHSKLAKIDLLPDIFNVYIPTGVSSFYYESISNPIELTANEIKINGSIDIIDFFASGTNGSSGSYKLPTKDFFSFQIKDINGLIYDFNDYDIASRMSYADPGDPGINIPIISAWHISKITDPSTNSQVNFEYEEAITTPKFVEKYYTIRRANTRGKLLAQCYHDIMRKTSLPYEDNQGNTVFMDYPLVHNFEFDPNIHGCESPSYIKMTDLTEYYKIKRLKKITFPEGFITFHYDFQRNDIDYDDKALSKIKIYDYNNKLINEFSFTYSYFECNNAEGIGTNPLNCNRLKLISVQEAGYPPYDFEYIEDIGLPRKNSRAFDFLGYYNGKHKSYMEEDGPEYTVPILYYYPNKGAWSILPFDISSEDFYVLKDDQNNYNLNRKSNSSYAKQGVLNKIKFPTNGYEEFVYELNTFTVFDKTINGGGIRIKKQIINDGKGNENFINYEYITDDNKSSGQLVRPPMFGFPQGALFDAYYELNPPPGVPGGYIVTDYNGLPNWDSRKIYNFFFINDSNFMDKDINNNTYVGYRQVKKIYSDGSYDKTKYTSRSDFPDMRGFGLPGFNEDMEEGGSGVMGDEGGFFDDSVPFYHFGKYGEFLQTNSNYEGSLYTDFSRSRGKPLLISKYDNYNNLRREIKYEYEKLDFKNSTFVKPLYSASLSQLGYLNKCCVLGIFYYGQSVIHYQTSRIKPILITETEFLYDGEEGYNDEFISKQSITYKDNSNRVKTISKSLNKPSTNYPYGLDLINKFLYPDDVGLPYSNNAILSMRNKNILSQPIVTIQGKGDNYGGLNTYQKIYKYVEDSSTSNLPLIGSVDEKRGNNISVNEASYKYDNKGNIIEYTLKNGTPVSIVWGYHQLYPIAKIEGIAYSSIPVNLITNAVNASNADNDSGYGAVKEGNLRTQLFSFRTNTNLSNALITTYTYDPLIGLTSVTNSGGLTGYYIYDTTGKLIKIIDQDGDEIKEFEYNYPTP